MVRAKLSTVVFTLVAACSAAAQAMRLPLHEVGSPFQHEQAWSIFARAMENHRKIPCKCLIWRRDMVQADSPLIEMWTEQSAEGELKLTVLSPLSEQGVTSVDDGNQWITYRPDDNRIMVETSPRRDSKKTGNRINLAQKNYELIVEPSEPLIAGRRAYSFLAMAKHSEMPARRFCIDKKKDFLLRVEVMDNTGCKVMLDTKTIDFPIEVPREDFALAPHESTEVETYPAPITVSLNKEIQRELGFKPCVPEDLPFGFVVDQPQLVEGNGDKYLAIRLTDGLVSATVYEWNGKKHHSGPQGPSKSEKSANGVKLRFMGEVPDQVSSGLMDKFVKEALKKVESCLVKVSPLETLDPRQALNSSEEANKEGCLEKTFGLSIDEPALILIEVDE
ncbi:MAG TPA: hypothetical protein VGL56_09620 [Fimbriimonadaceae bacterium]|jgi:hypothetical protein